MGARGYPGSSVAGSSSCPTRAARSQKWAADLGINDQTISTWGRQDRIDRCLDAGLTSAKRVEFGRGKEPDQGARGRGCRPPSGD